MKRFSVWNIGRWMIGTGAVIMAALLGMVCILINAQLAFFYLIACGLLGAGLLLCAFAPQIHQAEESLTS